MSLAEVTYPYCTTLVCHCCFLHIKSQKFVTLIHRQYLNTPQPHLRHLNTFRSLRCPSEYFLHIMSPSLLQIQTQASQGTQPISIGGSPKSRSNESVNTLSTSNNSASPKASLDIVRCSRCQRSLSIDPCAPPVNQGAVRFGLNSYYCSRCANVVGFVK